MSKGSDVRPFNKKKFDEEFERIFGKKKEKKKSWTVGMGRHLLTVWVDINGRCIPSHIQDLNKYKYRLGGIYLF